MNNDMTNAYTGSEKGAAHCAAPNAGIAPIGSFSEVLGNQYLVMKLKHLLSRREVDERRMRLFVAGPSGSGKSGLINHFAKSLVCSHPTSELDPCGNCDHCRQFTRSLVLQGLFAEGRTHYVPINCRQSSPTDICDLLTEVQWKGHPEIRLIHLEEASGLKNRQTDEIVMGYMDHPKFDNAYWLFSAMDATVLDEQLLRRCDKATTSPPDEFTLARYLLNKCRSLGIRTPEGGHPLLALALRCHRVTGLALTMLDGVAASGLSLTREVVESYPFPSENPWEAGFYYREKKRKR